MEVEKVIEELNKTKMQGFLTIANTGNLELDSAYKMLGDSIDLAIKTIRELQEQNKYKKFDYETMPLRYMECSVICCDGNHKFRREDTWLEIEGVWDWQSHFEGVYAPFTIAWMELPKFDEVE